MKRQEITHHSRYLDKDMHMIVYGEGGLPVLCFPTQNSMCSNFEDFGMVRCLHDLIRDGRVQLFTVDSVDLESWSCTDGIPSWRSARQESYYNYIIEEVLPVITNMNPSGKLPVATGCSMGANHAAIVFFRRPELFSGVIALSGLYDSSYFFGSYMDATLYHNSPERFLENMPKDHPYISIYNSKRVILCAGQGAWEDDSVRTLKNLERIFREKGIDAWCDFWGYDVNHDWPWWFKQMDYFLHLFLGKPSEEDF
jgi:esterase/lipase superfamily enzyme